MFEQIVKRNSFLYHRKMKKNTMNQSTYIEELLEMESDETTGKSDIEEFYSECNVLVTDATDFVNKLIIEKLLRSCPKIGKLFILTKSKLGVTYKDRLKSMFDDPLYERLQLEQPDFKSHVTLIEVDTTSGTSESELGLSSTSRDFLRKNTHVVIHKPVSNGCNERLRRAVDINVRSVKSMLQLATGMLDLKAFVYVSSAFSHYPNQYINERFYRPKMNADKLLSLMKLLDDNLVHCLTSKIIGKWPNTTTFSQSLGEELIQTYGRRLPICIVRSAIPLSTYKEPLRGCFDESHEITKSLASTALGAIRVLRIDGQCNAEVVPADFVVNNVLAAAWDVHETWSKSKSVKIEGEMEPTIYNCVSSCQKPIDWDEFMRISQDFSRREPSIMTLWYHFVVLVSNNWLYKVYTALLHLLPAVIIDAICQPKYLHFEMLSTYEKLHKVTDMITYYGSKEWVFGNSNVSKLWNKMSLVDRNKFDFNIDEFDWEEYMTYYTRTLRVHYFKDPMSSLKHARRKYWRFQTAHYMLLTFFYFSLAYIMLKIYNFI